MRLVISDLDRTLLDAQGQIPKYTRSVLGVANRNDVLFVPCTARSFLEIPKFFHENKDFKYLVSNNGALILDNTTHERILDLHFEPQFAMGILKEVMKVSPYWSFSYEDEIYMSKDIVRDIDTFGFTEHYKQYILAERKFIDDPKLLLKWDKPVYRVHCYVPEGMTRFEVMEVLAGTLHDCAIASSSNHNIEISHLQATKGDALVYLAEYLNVDISNTYAFGDDINDVGMVAKAGHGYAVANAVKQVKDVADEVIGDHADEAVAKTLVSLY